MSVEDAHDDGVAPDFVEALLAKADVLVPQYLAQLEDSAQSGGQKTKTFKCSSCGRGNTVSFAVMDAEQARKNIETLTALKIRLAAAKREASAASVDTGVGRILKDVRDLTNEELAAEISRLEGSLAPDRVKLSGLLDRLDADEISVLLKRVEKLARKHD